MTGFRRMMWIQVIGALIALTTTACMVTSGEPTVENAKQALEAAAPALGGAGLVPWPIEVNSESGEPIKDGAGAFKSGWDGTLAELLAADAFAQCASTTSDYHLIRTTTYERDADNAPIQGLDAYLNHLDALIGNSLTAPCYGASATTSVERWLELRANPKCSADASKQALRSLIVLEPGERVLDHVARDVAAYDTFNAAPLQWKPADNSWQLSGSASVIKSAHRAASRELSYADLNLCMAERLRAFVNSPAVFAAPPGDHRELLGVIRERAQLASTQFSMISTLFASFPRNDIPEHYVINDPNSFLILFSAWSHWAAANSPNSLARLGEDYARAIRLTISATFEFADLLARETSAAGTKGTWDLGSPRVRTMNLLYGGDPLGTPQGTTPRPGRGEGGTRADGKNPLHVETNLADPRFRLLFDLARRADALNFRVATAGGIDQTASSQQLYKSIEGWIRQQNCTVTHSVTNGTGTLGTSSCATGDILATLPSITDANKLEEFELWKRYQLRPDHATTFVKAFSEAFGELFTRDQALPNQLYVSLFHLLGKHGQVTIDGEAWFHVDPNSRIVPFRGPELARAYARPHWLPTWALTLFDSYPQDQGFVATTPLSLAVPDDKKKWEQLRAMGAVQALSYARQSLLGGAMPQAPAAAAPFFSAAKVALPDLNAAVGSRTITVQQNQYWVTSSSTCPYSGGAATCKRPLMFTHGPMIIEPVSDPPMQVVQVVQKRGIVEVARDPEFVPFLTNVSRADIDTSKICGTDCGGPACVPCNTPQVYEYQLQSYGKGLMWRFYGVPWYASRQLFVKAGPSPDESSPAAYFPLYHNTLERASNEGHQVGLGGALNTLGENVWAPLAENWSQPSLDAFGHKPTWAPATDAALLGGTAGEESFSYLLRQAKSSAEAAATSVQTAIAQIAETTRASSSAESAKVLANGTADIELASLCGSAASTAADPCAVPEESFNPAHSVDVYCPTDVGSGKLEYLSFKAEPSLHEALPVGASLQKTKQDVCIKLVFSLLAGVAEVKIRRPGYQSELVGSELGALLSEYRTEVAGYEQAVTLGSLQADSLAADVVTAYRKVDVAFKTRADQKSYVYGQLGCANEQCPCAKDASKCTATILPAQQQLAQLIIDEGALDEQRDVATALREGACARVGNVEPPRCPDTPLVSEIKPGLATPVSRDEKESFRAFGDQNSALGTRCIDRPWYIENKWDCDEAKGREADLDLTPKGAPYASINKQRLNLADALKLQIADQIAALQAADETFYLARQARGEAVRAARFGVATQIVQAQGHLARLADLESRYRALKVRAQQARARASLESSVEATTAKARYGLNTAFRSYDLWRSQALLRDARTMALAARKAIEQRFLVNLSENLQRQAFVDAPALWADDVYEPDLGAPTVIGLQPLESIPGAVYPNKLVDYVGNLERFVAGYPATHPTTQAQQDSEVITFPGPTSASIGVTESSSVKPVGWFFFCPESGRWLPAPFGDSEGSSNAAMSGPLLANLCDGKPPTRARFSFSLDPWGLTQGYFGSTPYQQRYNTRWRRFAVNLLGSGIRDCERAANTEGCGGSTFLRYSLTHSGPYWAVDYDRNWVDLQLPTGVIEGGKALATEAFLDPVSRGLADATVANAARDELRGRPVDGAYELTLELPSDVRLERIERLQLLTELDYWVRDGVATDPPAKGLSWSPGSEPSLVQWLSPRTGVQLDANSGVVSAVDNSFHGNVALQTDPAKRPTLISNSGVPAFSFDGNGRFLEVQDSPSLSWTQKGTYAFWVKFDDLTRGENVLGQWTGQSNRFFIRKTVDATGQPMLTWFVGVGLTSDNYTTASTPVDDQWHFWSFEFDGSAPVSERMTVYRDAVKMSPAMESVLPSGPQATPSPPAEQSPGNGAPMECGAYYRDGPPWYLKGQLGSIYVFQDVLDDSRRKQLMSYERP